MKKGSIIGNVASDLGIDIQRLRSDTALDRETVSEYNITVVATDAGMPPLSTKRTFHLKVSDVNENAPGFPQGVYNAFIAGITSPGAFILNVRIKILMKTKMPVCRIFSRILILTDLQSLRCVS
ncbi:hypothetical protein FQN60_001053 [Etheostoma spectabile]|uniref:Cadherin domain-containing protein n=1 Tax=Etheostoma spectabile TaxID=54343 RepID=A0A5J5CBX8_9PERO|nr:hypothetical protein FQN60_001053 [Etheostoma spectabile]